MSIFLFLFTVAYYLRGQAIIIKDATSHDIIARYFHCEIKPRIMPTKGQTSKCVMVKKQEYCYNVDILWVGAAITRLLTPPPDLFCVWPSSYARDLA